MPSRCALVICAALAGCGRLGFSDHLAPDAGTDAVGDAAPTSVLRAYVTCDGTPGTVEAFAVDETMNKLVSLQQIAGDVDSEVSVITSTHDWLYVGNLSSGDVTMFSIDATTGMLTSHGNAVCSAGVRPKGVQLDPTNTVLYVASEASPSSTIDVLVRDPATQLLQTIGGVTADDGSFIRADLTVGGGHKVLSANWHVSTLTQFDVEADGTLSATPTSIATNGGPDALAVDPAGTHLFVGGGSDSTIALHAIAGDGTVGALVASVPGPNTPTALAVDPSGANLYAAGFYSNDIWHYEIDPISGMLTTRNDIAETGVSPGGIAIDPAGRYLFATHYGSQDVWLFAIAADGSLTMADRQACPGSASSVSVTRTAD